MENRTQGKLRQSKISTIHSMLSGKEVQEMLLERTKTAALAFGVELLEQDVQALCGSPFSRKSDELCYRGGSEKSSLIVDGARYAIRRPRVKDENGEVELPMLTKLRDQDLLDGEILSRMVKGVSTRNYEGVIGGYAEKLGVTKSSASRAFIRASQKNLDELRSRDIRGYSFVALMLDGIEIAGRSVVGAIGITGDLKKIPLDIREGDTENSELVRDLLSSIVGRGFTLHCHKILAIVDGAKALKKALKDVFGDKVIVQRCWIHKLRNLKKYLPETYHPQLYWRLKKLMAINHFDEAKRELASLEHWLDQISTDAASSLREVGEELLTLHKLRIQGELRKALVTTNAMESLMGVIRTKTDRVKNWKSSKIKNQILRWVAASILSHEPKMRKLRGFRQNQVLIEALGGAVAKQIQVS
jgi:putative transposase